MELGQIEAFERAARDGNFTRAAESLGLTQPAISTRITTLENEIGGELFERRGRQLRLTPLGEHFLPYAHRVLAALADGQQAIRNFHEGHLGHVKIAAPTPFVIGFLVDILAAFRNEYPTVDILIRERNKTTIFDMLHDNAITLGLVNAPVFDQRLVQLARFRDPIRAVVAPKHLLAQRYPNQRPLKMEAIYQYTIFRVSMFPQMTAFIDDVVENARHGSGGAVIAVPMVMALRLVMMGQGVTFLPESYIQSSIKAGELVYLNIEDMSSLTSQPVLVAHRDRQLDSIHLAFVDILKSHLGALKVK
jgi:LysR family transcriptional activator of glutamate synthase operon